MTIYYLGILSSVFTYFIHLHAFMHPPGRFIKFWQFYGLL